MASGLDNGVITMKRGERAIFTLPPDLGFGVTGRDGVPPNSVVQFEVELVSWISVVDVSKDSGIIKKIIEKGQRNGVPSDLDEVLGTATAVYYVKFLFLILITVGLIFYGIFCRKYIYC